MMASNKQLEGLADDMDAMNNIAKASKLTAEEYKLIYEQAKAKVDKMDFSQYERRKKRKQKWADLEEKEKQQKKRERLREIAAAENANLSSNQDSETKSDDTSTKDTEDSDDFSKLFESETIEETAMNDTTEESVNLSQISISD